MKPGIQKFRGILWATILILLLAGCSAPPAVDPAPSPQAFSVALSPALQPMDEALHQCALDQPELALILNETPLNSVDFKNNELEIRLGPLPEGANYSAALAEEQIAVIVNPENSIKSLSVEDLGAIFSGKSRSWSEFGGKDREIQVWAAPPGNEVRRNFDSAVLSKKPLSSQAFLAPDSASMLSSIAADPDAIGYLPGAWLTDNVRSLDLGNALETALRQPALAIMPKEPSGTGRDFLYCLQSGPGQELIRKRYLPWK
jgi:hypothetical protein